MSYPFEKPIKLPFYGGERTLVKRDAMVVKVETDVGLVGWAPAEGSEKARNAIVNIIAPFLQGRTLADNDALRIQFLAGPGGDPVRGPELMKTFCSVEVALLDILGKMHHVPVSELLGGRVRDRIRLYGSAGMYMSPEGYAREAAAIAALGFRAYKMRPAGGPEADLRTIKAMREAVGPDFELMVDAHSWWRMGDSSYSPETVEKLAREMAEFSIAWLEEPMPPDDHEAYLRLKEKDIVPLASGEHEPNEQRYLDLIMTRAVDYVQMDVCCQGGMAMGRRIIGEVAQQNEPNPEPLKFAFHSWGTALEVVAAAHLGVCWPDTVVEWLEYPCYSTATLESMYPFPLASEVLTDPLPIDHGDLIVSREPGLGVTIDERVFEKYPWIPGPWSFFRTDSPAETFAVTSDHSIKWEHA